MSTPFQKMSLEELQERGDVAIKGKIRALQREITELERHRAILNTTRQPHRARRCLRDALTKFLAGELLPQPSRWVDVRARRLVGLFIEETPILWELEASICENLEATHAEAQQCA